MSKIAVVGVQENVGREILSFLEENGYKAADVVALEPGSAFGQYGFLRRRRGSGRIES